MNRKGKKDKRGWMIRVGWGKSKRKVRKEADDDDASIPLNVALGKVSRSMLEDDITLESGDIFTSAASNEEEGEDDDDDDDLHLIVPPFRLRQIDETRADCEDSLEKKSRNDCNVPSETSLREQGEGETNRTDQEKASVLKFSLVDFTTAPHTTWVCW